MSIQTFGWLGNKLGVKFTENSDEGGPDGSTEHPLYMGVPSQPHPYDPANNDSHSSGGESGAVSSAKQLLSGVSSGIGSYWSKASQKVSDMWQRGGSGGGASDPFGVSSQNKSKRNMFGLDDNAAGANMDVDENGLPVTKNWFYFDLALNRWSVTPEAPESVRREFEEKLQEAERERMGIKKEVAPPPAPHTLAPYAGGAPPPPATSAFGGARGRGATPHYAVPDYFGGAPSTPVEPWSAHSQPAMPPSTAAPAYPVQSYGVAPANAAPYATPSACTPQAAPAVAPAQPLQRGGWGQSALQGNNTAVAPPTAPAAGVTNPYTAKPLAAPPPTAAAQPTAGWASAGAAPAYPPASRTANITTSAPPAPVATAATGTAPSPFAYRSTAAAPTSGLTPNLQQQAPQPTVPPPQGLPSPASSSSWPTYVPATSAQAAASKIVAPQSWPHTAPSPTQSPCSSASAGEDHVSSPGPNPSCAQQTQRSSAFSSTLPTQPSLSAPLTQPFPAGASSLPTPQPVSASMPAQRPPIPVSSSTATATSGSNPFAVGAHASQMAGSPFAPESVHTAAPPPPSAASPPRPLNVAPTPQSPQSPHQASPPQTPPQGTPQAASPAKEAPLVAQAAAAAPPPPPTRPTASGMAPPPPSGLHRPEAGAGIRSRYSMPTDFTGVAAPAPAPAPATATTTTTAPPPPPPSAAAVNPAGGAMSQPAPSPQVSQESAAETFAATQPPQSVPKPPAPPASTAATAPAAWHPAPSPSSSTVSPSGMVNPFAASNGSSRALSQPTASNAAPYPTPPAPPGNPYAASAESAAAPRSSGGLPPPPSFKPFVPH